jgi:hypothetical protein
MDQENSAPLSATLCPYCSTELTNFDAGQRALGPFIVLILACSSCHAMLDTLLVGAVQQQNLVQPAGIQLG